MQTYEKAGLQFNADELPITCPWCSLPPPSRPKWPRILGEIATSSMRYSVRWWLSNSLYASVIAAVLEVSGQRVRSMALTPEPEMDEVWAEPEALRGAGRQGQSRPDQPATPCICSYPRAEQGPQKDLRMTAFT